MKKILFPLLALVLLCVSLTALAESGDPITLELKTTKLPLYAADDPFLDGLTTQTDPALPVLVCSVKKSYELQFTVQPKTVKNKKVTLTVDDEEAVRVKGNSVTGVKPGETVLTVASQENPSVTLQYRIVVIQPVNRISVTASEKSVAVGSSMTLGASFAPEDATRKHAIWSSADERIATVDENGTVTGVKRGNVRIVATATDGSNIRANISIQVTQNAEEIDLDKTELTVDIGRTGMLKATVLPKDTENKKVIWSSSDDSIATVNNQGRITAVSLGQCEIICQSQTNGEVRTKAVVHVQQPVKSITFGKAPIVYNGETANLIWTVEPANATNPAVKLTSLNEKILKVSDDGTITGITAGEAYVRADSTDGSNRQAKIKVKVLQHVTGVHMKRKVAYIDPKQTSTAGAILEPAKAVNHNMTWRTADPSVATVEPEKNDSSRVKITGVNRGETIITGTTEDGGFETSLRVKIGNFEKSLKWADAYIDGKGRLRFSIRNNGELNITSVKIELECYYDDGSAAPVNTKTGKNVVTAVYNKRLSPGATTKKDEWKMIDYDKDLGFQSFVARIIEFQIDNDWVKVIRKNNQPKFKYKP